MGAALARRLEAQHRAGHAHVDRFGPALHRDVHETVEMGVEIGGQAARLVPEDDRDRS